MDACDESYIVYLGKGLCSRCACGGAGDWGLAQNETDRTSHQSLPWSLLRSAIVYQFYELRLRLGAPNGDSSFDLGFGLHGLFSFFKIYASG
jgi:hypothetical protein